MNLELSQMLDLLEASPDALWSLAQNGRVLFCNRMAKQLLTGSEIGANFGDLTPFSGTGSWRSQGVSFHSNPNAGGYVVTGRPTHPGSALGPMFEQAPAPIVILSGPNHQVVFANAIYRKLFLPQPDYLGRTIADLLPDAAEQGYVALLNRVFQTGQRFDGRDVHFVVTHQGGPDREFYLNFVYEPLRDARGEIEGVIAVITDHTEEVRQRQALALEQHKLEEIFRDTPAALALWRGPDLVFDKVNPEYQRIFGERQLVGKPMLEALPELQGQGFAELLQQVLSSGIPYVGQEMPAQVSRQEGVLEQRFYDFTYFRIHDLEGRPYGVFDHAVDVTERVLARLALEESQAQLARAIRVAKIGFFDWNLTAGTLTLSEQMQNDWQVNASASLEQVADRIHPQDRQRVDAAVQSAIQTKQKYYCEYRVVLAESREIWVEAQGEATYDKDGQPIRFVGTAIDISERKRRQFELEAARLEAERANQTKSLFLANMSHEIRTPLGAILGFTDLLNRDDLDPAERSEFLSIISRNGRSLTRIIDDILDLAKVESGNLDTETLEFSPQALLEEVRGLLLESARVKALDFRLEIGCNAPASVRSDPTRVRQILVNLIGNAIKFTAEGCVHVCLDAVAEEVVIHVQDTGPGIPAEQRGRLFQAFVQADDSITRRYGGTGLGLILSQRLARLLGGDVVLEGDGSEVGSRFRFSFRGAPGEIDNQAGRQDGELKGQMLLAGRRLLVADDTADNRVLVSHLLTAEGAEVDLAADGEETVRAALKNHYDAVLLDLQMPRVDGYEALRRLQAAGYTQPVIALTAHAMSEERERTRRAGCAGHLTKPIDASELLGTLRRVLSTPSPHSV
jgi:signal transduction histidine kinase/ActR/RegA family two-component response regulator